MPVKDMQDGDLLYKILYPQSPEAQISNLSRETERLRKYGTGNSDKGGSGGGGGGGGPATPKLGQGDGSTRVPAPETQDISITSAISATAPGGAPLGRVSVAVQSDFQSVRGFLGYRLRITPPDGNAFEVDGPVYPDYAPSPVSFQAVPGLIYKVQVQVISDLWGASGWSDPVTYTAGLDTTAPATPTGVTSTALPNGSLITWTAPTEPDYSHTEVWIGHGSFTPGGLPVSGGVPLLVGTAKKPAFQIVWDQAQYTVTNLYDTVKVRHVDTSGNISSTSAGVSILTKTLVDSDVNVFKDPTKTQWNIETNPVKFFDASNNYRGTIQYIAAEDKLRISSSNPTSSTSLLLQSGAGPNILLDGTGTAFSSTARFAFGILVAGESSFPVATVVGQAFYRSDLGLWCEWDGTRWLGPKLHVTLYKPDQHATFLGTTYWTEQVPPTADQYKIESVAWWGSVATTNNLANYWTLRLGVLNNGLGGGAVLDLNTSGKTAGTNWAISGTPNTVYDFSNGNYMSLFAELRMDNGSPGKLSIYGCSLVMRRVYT